MARDKPGRGSGHSEIHGAEGSAFYAPAEKPDRQDSFTPKQGERRDEDRRKSIEQYFGDDRRQGDRRQAATQRGKAEGDTGYRLRSKAETLYPEAFIPVSKEFYNELTQEQRDQLMKLQAIAQEKAGYEKGTTKFFIRDFDPGGGIEGRYKSEPVDPVTDAVPRLVVGGALIGAGALATLLVVVHVLPGGPALAAGLIGLGAGVGMLISGRG